MSIDPPTDARAAASLPAAPAPPDRRRNVWRADLAAIELKGRVEAPRYTIGKPGQIVRAAVAMRAEPTFSSGLDNEALFGEPVRVYDVTDGWAWIQLERDGYVGYVPADAVSAEVRPITHRVAALGTFVYPAADIKAPPILHLSLTSRLSVVGERDGFVELAAGGFVVSRHAQPVDKTQRDFVELAERFIGTPYLWGGRTRLGLDCSGLVQLVFDAAGLEAPRDSDMQRNEIGADVLVPEDLEGLQRGDLVCWPGHIGIMADGVMLLHANAHHMAVVIEPLWAAAERIAKTGSKIAAVRRPAMLGA
jgi:cell wall-associated NlpC family hydrolase